MNALTAKSYMTKLGVSIILTAFVQKQTTERVTPRDAVTANKTLVSAYLNT